MTLFSVAETSVFHEPSPWYPGDAGGLFCGTPNCVKWTEV
jgi:hypothetical protein